MLDRRETKEDHLGPCIAQVTAIREVADASPLPRSGPHSPFIYLRPSRAIHKCVPHRAGFMQWIEQWKPLAYRGMEGVVELFGQAPRPVEPKAVSAKVRAAHPPSWLGVGLMQFKSIRESKN
jgi:hypothetical protein